MEAAALVEIAADSTAKDPSAEEAARKAKKMLIPLSSDNPSLSAFERARVVNYLGVLAYTVYDWPEARAKWQAVIPMYEAIGNRRGRFKLCKTSVFSPPKRVTTGRQRSTSTWCSPISIRSDR